MDDRSIPKNLGSVDQEEFTAICSETDDEKETSGNVNRTNRSRLLCDAFCQRLRALAARETPEPINGVVN